MLLYTHLTEPTSKEIRSQTIKKNSTTTQTAAATASRAHRIHFQLFNSGYVWNLLGLFLKSKTFLVPNAFCTFCKTIFAFTPHICAHFFHSSLFCFGWVVRARFFFLCSLSFGKNYERWYCRLFPLSPQMSTVQVFFHFPIFILTCR